MSNYVRSPDTQAILLLCASFGQNRQLEPQPLTLSEYNSLADWLREHQMRPADLLKPTAKEVLETITSPKLHPHRLLSLLERGAMLSLAVEKWTNQGLWVLGRGDSNYPRYLKQRLRHSAPAILYGVGNIELLSKGGLAIVGSRDVDEESLNYTHRVAQTCFAHDIQVVSGAARGIDQAAMLGVLESGGTSIGVLADSLTKASVNGKYRSSIKEGRLALISSYDPDASFNAGNAMGRNKYIYALADYALVVNSSLGKGGTWAGAVEALEKIRDVPIFVRMHPNASEGNQQLHDKGAKPFPSEPWETSFRELLATSVSLDKPVEIPQAIAHSHLQNSSDRTKDIIYEAVLPLILKRLQQPNSVKCLAESLNVRQSQMQDWLDKAVVEGHVTKTNKPVAYVMNQSATQLSFL